MEWTNLHASILGQAFEKVLGASDSGTMAFVRCLTPEVVRALAGDATFAPQCWLVWCVADSDNEDARTITADRAVELRETKGDAILLLVDTAQAGAGMDGIYSAAREVDEASLFKEALQFSKRHFSSKKHRQYAEDAVKKARGHGGRRFSVSPWTEFDFFCRVAAAKRHPGEYLHLLGLWPVQESESPDDKTGLNISRKFVDHLLGTEVSGQTPTRRIEGLRLRHPSEQQSRDLERFLRSAATKPLLAALAELADQKHLWINALRIEDDAGSIQSIKLSSWRTNTGKIAKWSGLEDNSELPVLTLPDDEDAGTGNYSKLEIKWRARPENLEKGAVEYHVAILTDHDEELASREVMHSAKKEEKCRFSNDDFATLSENALLAARVVVSVIGNNAVEQQKSEEFNIRFGQPTDRVRGGVGNMVRTFSEGLIELDSRDTVSNHVSSLGNLQADSKDFVLLRVPQHGKSFRVFRPALIHEVEQQWIEKVGEIGRWRVKVRASGVRPGKAEFVPIVYSDFSSGHLESLWDRVTSASRRMAERFKTCGGGVGQVYDEKSKGFETVVKEYLLAWAALLEKGNPSLALANTVEVQSLSGQTIGLIVLPSHPLRVAWLVAYDNLVLHAVFDQKMRPKEKEMREFSVLDGAMFPAFLPGLDTGSSFVFADTLGFHAVGMVPDGNKEPKAAVAILARALGESETADTVPTVGEQSAIVLGNEIVKYLECHNISRLLRINALRPGDGRTVARSLGYVRKWHEWDHSVSSGENDLDEDTQKTAPAFVLELYPSREQRGVAGRFIAEAREKRRSGAGELSPDDCWMQESLSLPGGVNLPNLRWARKSEEDKLTAAHLAVAFDTFESRVVPEGNKQTQESRPFYAFGLLSFFERKYSSFPSPFWRSTIPSSSEGEKHPSDRTHTERLMRLQQAIQRSVAKNIGAKGEDNLPALRTEISPDNEQNLRELHRLCDWVITLDRNSGVEYFDSPRDNKVTYDAFVIDCVPEREDLGCHQLITSTSNLEEVRNLLDGMLDQMGLSRSRRNAEFLMEHLKALSGRLAIRLTGQKAPTSELIALALSHANCRHAQSGDCWLSLESGLFIPVDDIRDLLPPLVTDESNRDEKDVRPDLIYISASLRKGLVFQFIEVKYRRHLRDARNPVILQGIRIQIESLRKRWDEWYGHNGICSSFRAIRRAKLARVLRFYADKAHRHFLPKEQYEVICSEIDRMIEKGGDYSFAAMQRADRGWVFCPEYTGATHLEISPAGWDTRIFLFGPGVLPDSDCLRESIAPPHKEGRRRPTFPSVPQKDEVKEQDSSLDSAEQTAVVPNDTTLEKTTSSEEDAVGVADAIPSVGFGKDVLTGTEIQWSLTIKGNPHLLITGLPGMGKTTCLLNMCKQMVGSGVRPIIFSYHQDIDERLELLVDSVRFIDFRGLGFNPLQVIDRNSRTAYLDVAGALRDIFVAVFPELGDIQAERIRKAIKDSFIEAGWNDPGASLSDIREPEFKRFVEILRDDPKPDRGLRMLLARLEELGDYGFFELGESQESLWESDQPIVIRIHTTQNDNLQKAFASLVLYDLYKNMFRRGIQDRITHAVVFDEAHRAAGLKLIPTMAKECRKYGISFVLASQATKDFNVSLFSAIANYLVMRLIEPDAKALVRNVTSSDQERALVDKIKQMEKFRALYFCEGKKKPSVVALWP